MHQYSLGRSYMITGECAAAIEAVDKVQRLGPQDPLVFDMMSVRSLSLSMQESLEEAVAFACRAVQQPNAHYHLLAAAACTLSLAGLRDRARAYVARLQNLRPGYSAAAFLRAAPFRQEEHIAKVHDALTALGLRGQP